MCFLCFGSIDDTLRNAAEKGNVAAVRKALDGGADIACTDMMLGYTPLHLAAEGGHLEVVRLLVERGAAVTNPAFKPTPLALASREGHLEVVRLLLEHGSNVNAKDREEYFPLYWAADGGHLEIVRLLLEHGADKEAKTRLNQTPLAAATGKKFDDICALLQ